MAFHVPALDCIHADGEKVALTCWGFTSAPSQSEEFNLIKTIRSQADEKLGETEDAADAPSTKIRIRVVDKEERPAPNIRVTASYKEASAESHTDSEGRASFPKVPLPSDVKLLITLPEYPAFETHVLCEKADEEHLIPLPFVFKPKAVMRFQVMNAKKRGLKKVPLRLEWKKGELEDTTDSEGRSEFSDIPLGEKLTLHVCHSKKAPLVKEFQCCQGEELHQIVIDPPKRNYKRLIWIIVCIFVLSAVGIPIWWLTKAPPAPSEQPAVSHPLQTGTAVRQSGEDCRCKEEIDALWEEIRRMKDEI